MKKPKTRPWRKQDDPNYQKASKYAALGMDWERYKDEDEAMDAYRERREALREWYQERYRY